MMNNSQAKRLIFWFCTLLMSLFASYQVYQATSWGALLFSDSVGYINGAHHILENVSLKGLGDHYPPLYFILIALSTLICGDTFVAVRWLQIGIMAANVVIFVYIIWEATRSALIPALVGLLLFSTSQSILYIHTMAMSDACFILFAMLGFYWLAIFLQHGSRFSILMLSSLSIGMAFITRYVGVTLIITGLIALFFFTDGTIKKRIANCIFFGFISSLPMIAWMGRNWLLKNELTSRQFILHPISLKTIYGGIHVLLNWLFIPAGYSFLLVLVIALIAVLYFTSVRQTGLDAINLNRLLEICFIFVVIYIPFLFFSISFFDGMTPLDKRMLCPVYVFFILGLLLLNQRISKIKRLRNISFLAVLLMLLLAFFQLKDQKQFVSYAIDNGLGLASKKWVQSDILQWLKEMPVDVIIYTNGPDPIQIYTNRPSIMIPRHSHPGKRIKNDSFMREINAMVSKLSNNDGLIIYFNTINRNYLPTISQLNKIQPLQLVFKGKDGVVMRLAGSP